MTTLRDHVVFYGTFLGIYTACVAVGAFGAEALGIYPPIGGLAGQLTFLGAFLLWASRNTERYR